MRPLVGAASPVIKLNKVVLPAPLGPMTAKCFAAGDGDVDVVYGFERTVMLGHRLKLEKGRHEQLSCTISAATAALFGAAAVLRFARLILRP